MQARAGNEVVDDDEDGAEVQTVGGRPSMRIVCKMGGCRCIEKFASLDRMSPSSVQCTMTPGFWRGVQRSPPGRFLLTGLDLYSFDGVRTTGILPMMALDGIYGNKAIGFLLHRNERKKTEDERKDDDDKAR